MNKYIIVIAMLLNIGAALDVHANPNRNTPTRDGGSRTPSPFLMAVIDPVQEAADALINPLTQAMQAVQINVDPVIEDEQEGSTANASPVTNISPVTHTPVNINPRTVSPILARVMGTNTPIEIEGRVVFPQNQAVTAGGVPQLYNEAAVLRHMQTNATLTNSPANPSGDPSNVIAPISLDDFNLNDNNEDE